MSRYARLTSLDRMFLHLESPAWPGQFGGLAVVEGKALLDSSGLLRLAEIQRRINCRLVRVPQLRRRLHFPGPLGGRPLWVDDQTFDIRNHVREAAIEPTGGDAELLDAAARLYGELLDRGRPLWELWFMTGLRDGRLGVLLKLHHSVADGLAAVGIMSSLLDFEPDAPDPAPESWTPEPVPMWWALVSDNFATKMGTARRLAATLRHPGQLMGTARVQLQVARATFRRAQASQTSLNQPVRIGRRIRFLHFDLDAMKEVAHSHEAKVNDVVLDLWSGGLRELMQHRGESMSGVELIADMPISLRSQGAMQTLNNEVGFVALQLPVWEADAQRRLDLIVRTTRKAKSEQQSAQMAGLLAFLSAMPLAQYLTAHQHNVNVRVSNVMGPPVPVYVLGARILDILPIMRLFGNVGLVLCAFSYAGQLALVVTADATAFSDLDVLMEAMERDWAELSGSNQKVESHAQQRGALKYAGTAAH